MINFSGASVLITGGTGTFGTAAVRMILKTCNPARLIVFSRGEHRQAEMAEQMRELNEQAGSPLRFFVGDVRDPGRLEMAMRGVDHVIHAAALKRIESCEYNPQEAIATNIDGSQNVIRAAIAAGVQKVLALSSDKAAAPTTLYGATKLAMERLFCAGNALVGPGRTTLASVRYGNVLGSAGSVLPLFRKLLDEQYVKAGLNRAQFSLPITHLDMTRFFWTADDAVKFTLMGMQHYLAGQVMLPRIKAVRIADLARAVTDADYGRDVDLELKVVGIRPGEKLHETMLSADEAATARSGDGGSWMIEIPPIGMESLSEGAFQWLNYQSGNPGLHMSIDEIRAMIDRHDKEAFDV